jgi:hypothetical protein
MVVVPNYCMLTCSVQVTMLRYMVTTISYTHKKFIAQIEITLTKLAYFYSVFVCCS